MIIPCLLKAPHHGRALACFVLDEPSVEEPGMIDRLRSDLDVRLLRTLHLLLTESNVSRVAHLLGQSQPAVSATLKRLRTLLGDPLLVRGRGGRLLPSERGMVLVEAVGRILTDLDRLFDVDAAFDPATARRQAHIVASNCLGALLLPPIVERVRAEAPNVSLDFCPRAEDCDASLLRRLESGEIDVVIGNWPSPCETLRFAPLLDTDTVCVLHPSHTVAGAAAMSLERYLAVDHISPTAPSSCQFSPIDGRLAELGVARRIAVAVPEYALIGPLLTRGDLVFTTGRPFANELATRYPLVVLEAPRELGRMPFYMLWHEKTHGSPFARWLRDVIRSAVAGLEKSPGANTRPEDNLALIGPIRARHMAALPG